MGVKGYTPKSTRTQGGDPIADYIRADTRLPAYLPYPRFLLKMEISQTAKLLYSLLLDRSTLSQKNKWLDDEGRIYIIYPIAEIAEILDKGSTTIKGALNELDTAGLLERERGGFSAPNRLYVKVPPVPQVQFSDQLMAGSPPLIEPENRPTDGQKTDLMMVGKPSPNQTTINNLTESQTKGVSGGPSAPYGRYGNIFLSQTEYDELQAEYPDRLERFIEEMSRYLAANGKSYQNYAAALRIWAGNDKKEAPKKGELYRGEAILSLLHTLSVSLENAIAKNGVLSQNQDGIDIICLLRELYEKLLGKDFCGSYHSDLVLLDLRCTKVAANMKDYEKALGFFDSAYDEFLMCESRFNSGQCEEDHYNSPLFTEVANVHSPMFYWTAESLIKFLEVIPKELRTLIKKNKKYKEFY